MKQIIVMRKDLKMRRGKEIAQGAHASMKATLEYSWHPYVKEWLEGPFTKIVVTVNSYEELFEVYKKAVGENIPRGWIVDVGRTEFHGVETVTCCAVGPAPNDVLEEITGGLPLY